MFDLDKILKEVRKILPNAQVHIAITSPMVLELCIKVDCPESGVRFGQAQQFKILDVLNNFRDSEYLDIAKYMAIQILKNPNYKGKPDVRRTSNYRL